jgi:hypothetical protein
MFGGEQGERLSSITKFTFWFLDVRVVGMEFHYDNGDPVILGKRYPLNHVTPEQALYSPGFSYVKSWYSEHALDGPGGEVITGFCVPEYPAVCHLKVRPDAVLMYHAITNYRHHQVCTSFGRTIHIEQKTSALRWTLPADPKPVPIEFPKSTTIVGVYVDLVSNLPPD